MAGRPTCRIVVVGDAGVGKSSLISSLISESFSEEDIPSVMKTVKVPLEDMYLHIVDTSSDPSPAAQASTHAQILRADVIILVTAPHPDHHFLRVRSYWLPLLDRLHAQAGRRCPPVVLAINKSREFSDNSPDMQHFQDLVNNLRIEVCKQCSAKNLNFVNDVFYHAQRAVVTPIRPLYDPVAGSISPLYAKALERIFRLIDINHDGLLDNNEFNVFQMLCFGRRLLAGRIEDLKRLLIQKQAPVGPAAAGGSSKPPGDSAITVSSPSSSVVAAALDAGDGKAPGGEEEDTEAEAEADAEAGVLVEAEAAAGGEDTPLQPESHAPPPPSPHGVVRGRSAPTAAGVPSAAQPAYLVSDPKKANGQLQVTLAGFMAFNLLFIKGVPGVMARRADLAWTILRRFGYDSDLYLRPGYVPLPGPLAFDQSAELTQEGIAFLTYLFHQYDRDRDGGLSHLRTSKEHPSELECIWASCPDVPFIGDFTANYCTTPGRPGFLNLRGWLAYWSLLTLYEPLIAMRSLTYLGYPTLVLDGVPQDPLALPNSGEGGGAAAAALAQTVTACYNDPTLVGRAIRIHPRKDAERRGKALNRAAVSVLVFGGAGSGKTTLLQALVGKPFSSAYEPTGRPLSQANWVPTVPGKDGNTQPFRPTPRTGKDGVPDSPAAASASTLEASDLEVSAERKDVGQAPGILGGGGGGSGGGEDEDDELLAAVPHQFPLDIEGSGRRFLIMTEIPAPQQMPLLQQQTPDVERADLVLLTYDGTDRQSYQECLALLRVLHMTTSGKIPVIVLRTKADLPGCRPLQQDINECPFDVTFHSVSIKTQPDELLFSRLFQAALNPRSYLAQPAGQRYRTLIKVGLGMVGAAAAVGAGLWWYLSRYSPAAAGVRGGSKVVKRRL